jgi:hypothetical protein
VASVRSFPQWRIEINADDLAATATALKPVPALARQSGVKPAVGHAVIEFISREMPLSSGPRNCGQSPTKASRQKVKIGTSFR